MDSKSNKPLTKFTIEQNLENMRLNKEKFVKGLGKEQYDAAIKELEDRRKLIIALELSEQNN